MHILSRKYPFKQSSHWLRDSIVFGAVVWGILFLLQPFGLSSYAGNKCLVAASFALVTTCCCALYGWVVFHQWAKKVRLWRIWHQGCAVLGLILFIAICNFLLFTHLFHYPVTLHFFLMPLKWTLLIGVIITILSVGIEYNRSMRERLEMLLSNTTEEQRDTTITIHDNSVRGNDLTIPVNSLLYIEAQKNNVSVCFMKGQAPVSVSLHTTLSAVVNELKDCENIFQCHRSFVVNVNNITSAKGNSNGYQLLLGNSPVSIPVSRTYVARLKSYIA